MGGATVDIVVAGASVQRGPGAKQDVERIDLYGGGGAVNTALTLAACGAQVRAICAVGQDFEGQLLRALLLRRGINTSGMQLIPEVPTGKAVVMVGADGEASVFAQRGASSRLSLTDRLPSGLRADVLYVSALSDKAARELATAPLLAKLDNSRLVLNPGARQIAQADMGLLQLLSRADLVCLNAVEAQMLAYGPDLNRADTLLAADVGALAARIVRRPGQGVLVTLGASGAVYVDGQEPHHLPAPAIPVVSSLGAGDAFASCFAFHWASGAPARLALAAAMERAEMVLQVLGANLEGPLTLAGGPGSLERTA